MSVFIYALVLICRITAYNFSHRIDHLSFGEVLPGLISTLDGTEKIAPDCKSVFQILPLLFINVFWSASISTDNAWCFSPANHMFQYFITIVPTKLNTYKVSAETHQYSVTERVRLSLHCCSCGVDCVLVYWMCLHISCRPAGTCHKPCCRQPWSLRDLYEIWYQLTNGQRHWAAHASLAVSRQTLWHHWRHFLHHGWVSCFSSCCLSADCIMSVLQ